MLKKQYNSIRIFAEGSVGYFLPHRKQSDIKLISGFPKCATSSVADALRSVKGLYVPWQKELHFLSTDGLSDKQLRDEFYSDNPDAALSFSKYSNFNNLLKLAEFLGCEPVDATPSYVFHPERVYKSLSRHNLSAKTVLMVRHPIDACISHYFMQRTSGVEQRDFGKLLDKALSGDKTIDLNYRRDHFNTYCYSKLIPNYLAYFPETLIIKQELLDSQAINKILEFFLKTTDVAINVPAVNTSTVKNYAVELKQKYRLKLENFYSDDIEFFYQLDVRGT